MNIRSLFLSALAVAGLASAQPMEPEADIGKIAPAFSLPDKDGGIRNLSDCRGKYVVLEWTNFECPFVRKHYNSGNMQRLQNEFTAQNVVWFSICSSAKGKQGYLTKRALTKKLDLFKPLHTAYLMDTAGSTGRLYGAKTTPHMFVVNPEGILIYAGAIDNRPSTDTADIKGAVNYVSQALTESLSGKEVSVKTVPSYGCSVKY